MRILLATNGSHGDVHPFVALARALGDRGHSVALQTNPYFAPVLDRAGVELAPGVPHEDLREVMKRDPVMHPLLGPLVVLRRFMAARLREMHDAAEDLIRARRFDVVVFHPLMMGVGWAARARGVPSVQVALSPSIWMSRGDPLVMSAMRRVDPGARAVALDLWLGRVAMGLAVDPAINRARRRLALPRTRLLDEFRAGDASLGLWSPHFRAPLETDPPGSRVCGFLWHDAAHERAPELDDLARFLDAGEAPIVFSLGSAGVHAPGRFYEHAVRTCQLLDRRGVLVVGRDEPAPDRLPTTVRAFSYLPFSLVFPRGAAIVHHGGIGTTAQALRAGRPQLVTPMAHDQFDNAARVQRLGVGESLSHARARPDRWAGALDRVLSEGVVRRAAELGSLLAPEDGAVPACEAIESVGRGGGGTSGCEHLPRACAR